MSAGAWRATALAALAASTILTGCGREGDKTQARGAASGAATTSAPQGGGDSRYADARTATGGGGGGGGGYGRDEAPVRPPVPSFHGEPMWSDSRKYSAEENATYHFQRAGADLGAKTLDEFLTKVHHFIDHPPEDVQVITRSNGDRLLYDPKDNLFAVARADGAPRTIFKPSSGAAYWDQQKTSEAARASGKDEPRSYRRERAYSDNGGGGSGAGAAGSQDGG